MKENENNDNVLKLKRQGAFFHAYDTDCIVLHNLLGYKITRHKNGSLRCGVGEKSITKVTDVLRSTKISYAIDWAGKESSGECYDNESFEDNQYEKYASLSPEHESLIIEAQRGKKEYTIEEKKAVDFLTWLYRAGENNGITCTINPGEPWVHEHIRVLLRILGQDID